MNQRTTHPTAVVLLSGGMDSSVTLAQAIAHGYQPAALHVNYGQLTQARELQAFEDMCNHYAVDMRLVVDISHLAQIGGSALTDPAIAVPSDSNLDVANPSSIPPVTYVPFRNANILAIATSWAEVLQASALYIGAVEEDGSGYPDCTGRFFKAFQETINTGTSAQTNIAIKTPLLHLSKSEIVSLGLALGVPFSLSWSCYSNEDHACGRCDSCRLRLRGFAGAGVADPIPYSGGLH